MSKLAAVPSQIGRLGDEPRPDQAPVLVQVRPKGVGPWSWPHHDGGQATMTGKSAGTVVYFEWMTISAEVPPRKARSRGVRVVGYSAEAAGLEVPWDRAEEVVDAWFDAHDEEAWPWEFRLVTP